MANRVLKMLQLHGLDVNDGEVISVNEDQSFNWLTKDGTEYLINGDVITKISSKNKIKRPRGWHLKPVFTDSEGNVYIKGVLNPDLKKKES